MPLLYIRSRIFGKSLGDLCSYYNNLKLQLLQEIAVLFEERNLSTFADKFWRNATSLVIELWAYQEHVELMQRWGEYLIEHRKWHLIEPIMITLFRHILYNLYDAHQYKNISPLESISGKVMTKLLSRLPSAISPNILLNCVTTQLYSQFRADEVFHLMTHLVAQLRLLQQEDTITVFFSLLATEILSISDEKALLPSGGKQGAGAAALAGAQGVLIKFPSTIPSPGRRADENDWNQFIQAFISFLQQEGRWELAWKLVDRTNLHSQKEAPYKAKILINLIITPQSVIQETVLEQFINHVMEIDSLEECERILEQLQSTLEKIKDPGELYRLLHITHRFWVQANTKQHALALLTLGNIFIFSQSSIGTAFCEAFAWVDTFLQG